MKFKKEIRWKESRFIISVRPYGVFGRRTRGCETRTESTLAIPFTSRPATPYSPARATIRRATKSARDYRLNGGKAEAGRKSRRGVLGRDRKIRFHQDVRSVIGGSGPISHCARLRRTFRRPQKVWPHST